MERESTATCLKAAQAPTSEARPEVGETMPSEKAKDNKALAATCVACNKAVSTESMVSLLGRENGKYKQFDTCLVCANGGWRPPGFEGIYTARPI
jgi:hypothetical protein